MRKLQTIPEQIINDEAGLAACCEHLDSCPVIGFDTEFVGEDTYVPDLCLIQVATPDRLILIDPIAIEDIRPFWERIIDPERVVVVHAGREEIRLCHFGIDASPANLFDVQIAAGLLGLGYPIGYANLIQEVLGCRLHKAETLTDWRRRPLTTEQVTYAYDDVRHLLPLWEKLSNRLEKLDRLSWAAEEFEALKHRAVVENPAVEKWRKLRGIGNLDRTRLAVAREVYAWREEKAARLNRPARSVLRDDLIVEVARRNPSRARDIHALRGMSSDDCEAIVAAAIRARGLPPDEWPAETERDNDPPQVGLVAGLLCAVLGDICARNELTPSLVASNQDLKLLVRSQRAGGPVPMESHLARGWRREHILPELQAVLEGGRAVRVADLASPAPFEYARMREEQEEDKGTRT